MALGATVRSVTRRFAPVVVVGATWLLMVLYAFPGIMTIDSFDQLGQGRRGSYTDGHPPFMAALWGVVDAVVSGPLGVFLLQTATFVIGVYALLRRTFAPARAAWLGFAISLFPPVLAPMGVIWKDALMAGFLVLGIAALLDPRRGVRLLALVAIFVATAVRYNTPAATLPLIVLLFEWSPAPPTWPGRVRRYAISTAAWVAVTGAAFAVNGALTDKHMHFWHSSIAVHDIAGVLAHVEPDLPDAELRPLFEGSQPLVDRELHATLRARYSPNDFVQLVLGEHRVWDLPIWGDQAAPPKQRAAIERAWKHLVFTYPRAYFAHRIATFTAVLGISNRPGGMVLTKRAQPKDMSRAAGVATTEWAAQNWVYLRIWRIANRTPLFRGWFYLALSLLLLPLCRGQRDVFALLLSGLGLEASLFPLAATPDFRYSHWLVVCTLIAIVVLVARRYRRARQPC